MVSFFAIIFTLILIGIGLMFFYSTEDKKLDSMKKDREEKENNLEGADPRIVYGKKWDPKIKRPRICPICGKALKKTEFLYAYMESNFDSNGRMPVHIYGCKFCYLGKVEEGISENLDF
jgi:hypothetical protein